MDIEPEGADLEREDAGASVAAPRARRRVLLRALLIATLVLLLVAAEWAIRVGEPKVAPTSGVDTLVLPWQDPRPDDFVDGIDHDWWPLEPGARWEYSTLLTDADTEPGATLEVLPEPAVVAGIATTPVRWSMPGVPASTLLVAQDHDGNLWLLGIEAGRLRQSWSIEDGRPAGLLLPARPRRGDGHGVVYGADGAVLARAGVQEMSGPEGESRPVQVPAGEFDDVLRVQWSTLADRSDGFPVVVTSVLAKGVGPVVLTPSTSQPLRLVAVSSR